MPSHWCRAETQIHRCRVETLIHRCWAETQIRRCRVEMLIQQGREWRAQHRERRQETLSAVDWQVGIPAEWWDSWTLVCLTHDLDSNWASILAPNCSHLAAAIAPTTYACTYVHCCCCCYCFVKKSNIYLQREFSFPSVLWHRWLGDRKGIQPVYLRMSGWVWSISLQCSDTVVWVTQRASGL